MLVGFNIRMFFSSNHFTPSRKKYIVIPNIVSYIETNDLLNVKKERIQQKAHGMYIASSVANSIYSLSASFLLNLFAQ